MSDDAVKLARDWLCRNAGERVQSMIVDAACVTLLDEAGIATLARAVIDQADDIERLRETVAASAEVREAITIAEALDENERIRGAVTELMTKLESGAKVSGGFCSWCRERWLHPDDATVDDVRDLARVHAYRCKVNPLKLERDALLGEVAQLRAALTMALDRLEHEGMRFADDAQTTTIAELRKLVTP